MPSRTASSGAPSRSATSFGGPRAPHRAHAGRVVADVVAARPDGTLGGRDGAATLALRGPAAPERPRMDPGGRAPGSMGAVQGDHRGGPAGVGAEPRDAREKQA